MYDFLLFVHVLAAFMLFVTVVFYSAFVLGAPAPSRAVSVAGALWDVGGIGTLIFGIWLAFDSYEITDGWILAAIVLWAAVAFVGQRARVALAGPPGGEAPATPLATLATWHWLRVVITVGLLLLMIYKPGA